MTMHDPSNAELAVMLRQISESAESRDRAHTEQQARIYTMVRHQGDQIVALTQRVTAVESGAHKALGDARQALDSQADLEGSLHRELAANDRKQNGEIQALREDVTAIRADLRSSVKALSNSVHDILTWKRAALLLVALAPGAWAAFTWALEHGTK